MNPLIVLEENGYELFYPCWLEHNGKYKYLIKHSDRAALANKNCFALMKFSSIQRYLLPDGLNMVAVHKSRVEEFQRIFLSSSK